MTHAVLLAAFLAAPLAAQTPTISVTVNGTANQATLSWSQLAGPTRYAVMRHEISVDPRGMVRSLTDWASVATLTIGTYSDVLPKPSALYEYRIDATARTGTVSSAPVRYATPAFTTATNVAVSGASSQATVSWAAAMSVTGYNVWRRTVKTDGSVADLSQRTPAPIAATSFADALPALGTTYEYQVVSADPSGATYPSTWVRYSAPAAATPPVVTVVGAGDKATLSWTATAGAVGYSLSRAPIDAMGRLGPAVMLTQGTLAALTFTDALPAPGTPYGYTVTAVMPDMSTVKSPNVPYFTPAYTTPGNVLAAGAGGKVGVTWCAAWAVAGYVVWRRTVRTDGTTADLTQLTPRPIPTPGFVDAIPTPGLIYEYQVVGVGLDGRLWPAPWARYSGS